MWKETKVVILKDYFKAANSVVRLYSAGWRVDRWMVNTSARECHNVLHLSRWRQAHATIA